jgi:membrane protein
MLPSFSLLKSAWTRAQENDAGLLAAGIAYYAFLSFVPLLIAAVLSYGIFADPQTVTGHAESLAATLPASASELVVEQMRAIAEDRGDAKGLGLLLALALALFSARVAAGAVITAFNIAFDSPEDRGFIKSNLLALSITIGAIAAMGLVAAATSASVFLFPDGAGAFATFLVIGLAGIGGAVLAYRIVPNVGDVTMHEAVRGALPFGASWMLASAAFGYYVSNIASYNATYGSLGAIVVLLTWLFLSAYLLLLGAHVAAAARDLSA